MKKIEHLVCTICWTYNHAPYITDTMNGFSKQETTFPVIYVIIDDASTDGEQKFIDNYLLDNFDLNDSSIVQHKETDDYKLVFSQHNTNKNCFFAVLFLKYNHYSIKKAKRPYYVEWENKAKYLALCEGDDYWIDPLKLQKQVDALEAHPELDMCACGAKVTRDNIEISRISPCSEERVIPTKDVIEGGGGFFATNSLVLRTSAFKDDSYHFWRLMTLDYTIQILGALRGGVYYLPQCMAVYRSSTQGSWSQTMDKNQDACFDHIAKLHQNLCILDYETNFRYTESISKRRVDHYFMLFKCGIIGSRFDNIFSNLKFSHKVALILRLIKKMIST